MKGPRVEVLVERDPDGPSEVRVWVDGCEVTWRLDGRVRVEHVDPGAGHTLSAWRAMVRDVAEDESLSPSFREAFCSTATAAEASPHITA